VTPRTFTGSNSYTVSPDGRFAFHRFSSFDDPEIRELVSLPDPNVVTVIDDKPPPANGERRVRRCAAK
jgi:dipeptidyl-peptidase-4